mgnify:CR=1 FL=1
MSSRLPRAGHIPIWIGPGVPWMTRPSQPHPCGTAPRPCLSRPAPRAADGKPDLSGVWMHETTSVADVRRLFGSRLDADIALAPPGMEIGTQSKYAFAIRVDFKPGESPMRPAATEALKQRAGSGRMGAV